MIDGKAVIRKIIEGHPAQEPAQNFIGTDDQIKKWINDSYEKVCKVPWINPSTGVLSEPLPTTSSAPATPSLDTDHAWDMVVLAARASRYE